MDQHVRRQSGPPSSCLPGMPHSVCSSLGIPIASASSTQDKKTSETSKASHTSTGVKSKGPTSPSRHDRSHSKSDPFGVGTKAGISVGVTVAATIGILVLLVLCRKRRAKAKRIAGGTNDAEIDRQGLSREKSIKAYFIPSWKSELSGVPAPAELEGSSGRVEQAELRESRYAVELDNAGEDAALETKSQSHNGVEGSKDTARDDDAVGDGAVLETTYDASHSNGPMENNEKSQNKALASRMEDAKHMTRAENDAEDVSAQSTDHDVPRSYEVTVRNEKSHNEIFTPSSSPPPIPYASKPTSR